MVQFFRRLFGHRVERDAFTASLMNDLGLRY